MLKNFKYIVYVVFVLMVGCAETEAPSGGSDSKSAEERVVQGTSNTSPVKLVGNIGAYNIGSYAAIILNDSNTKVMAAIAQTKYPPYALALYDSKAETYIQSLSPVAFKTTNTVTFKVPEVSTGDYVVRYTLNAGEADSTEFDVAITINLVAISDPLAFVETFTSKLKIKLEEIRLNYNNEEMTNHVVKKNQEIDTFLIDFRKLGTSEQGSIAKNFHEPSKQLFLLEKTAQASSYSSTKFTAKAEGVSCLALSKQFVAISLITYYSVNVAAAGFSSGVGAGLGFIGTSVAVVSMVELLNITDRLLNECITPVGHTLISWAEGKAQSQGFFSEDTRYTTEIETISFNDAEPRTFTIHAQQGIDKDIVKYFLELKAKLNKTIVENLPANIRMILVEPEKKTTSNVSESPIGFTIKNITSPAISHKVIELSDGISIEFSIKQSGTTSILNDVHFSFDLVSPDGLESKMNARVLLDSNVAAPAVSVMPKDVEILISEGQYFRGSANDAFGKTLSGSWYHNNKLIRQNGLGVGINGDESIMDQRVDTIRFEVDDGYGNIASSRSTITWIKACAENPPDNKCLPKVTLLDEFSNDLFGAKITLILSVKGWISYVEKNSVFLYEKLGLPELKLNVDDADSAKFHLIWQAYMPGRVLQQDGIGGVYNGSFEENAVGEVANFDLNGNTTDKDVNKIDVAYELTQRIPTSGEVSSYFADINDYGGTWNEAYVQGRGNKITTPSVDIHQLALGDFYKGCLLDDVGGYIPMGQSISYTGPRSCNP